MKKIISLFAIILIICQASAQKNIKQGDGSLPKVDVVDSMKIYQFNVKSSLLTPIDPLISSVQLGLEYRFNHRYALEASYYQWIPSVMPLLRNKENEKLLKYKVEVKYFFQDQVYIGVEYGYFNYSYDYADDYFTPLTQEDEVANLYRYESATFNKTVNMYNVKFGVQQVLRKHPKWLFDGFAGVGIRTVNIDYTNVVNPLQVPVTSEAIDRQAPPWDLTEGFTIRGSIVVGLKVGYILWSKNY